MSLSQILTVFTDQHQTPKKSVVEGSDSRLISLQLINCGAKQKHSRVQCKPLSQYRFTAKNLA